MALAYARRVRYPEMAIRSRQLLGPSVGVVMERFHLDDARAFAFLAGL